MAQKRHLFSANQVFVLGFLSTIFIGALLLMLPFSQAKPVVWIDALFTSASATCVTGLATIDISTALTLWGKIIVLMLIQIGGLGIMTYSVFFTLLLKKEIQGKTSTQLQSLMDINDVNQLRAIVIAIIKYTAIIEIFGATILYNSSSLQHFGMLKRMFYAVFHSISAFCNAGFGLFSDSLAGIQSPLFLLCICLLIILGGLGFEVHFDLKSFNILKPIKSIKKLNVHSRIVLTVTFWLLVVGTGLVFFLEYFGALAGFSLGNKLLHSFFLSVSSRTAGFNTLSIGMLHLPTIFMLFIFMYIGASPGSTGGGIKTSTFGILWLKVRQILLMKKDVEAFGRKIPESNVTKALAVLFLSLMILSVFIFLLLIVDKEHSLHELIFEAISAFGTVGLSTGITPMLNEHAKLIIILLMLVGRVGPLTLAYSLTRKQKQIKYSLPEEKVLVG
ncbi:MAG: hypothetical protein A2X42_00885 [Candidatus Margulisbacteria bacterium GWF2_38_17]|nr:MAG: hypothetical protein A2X42_00885 [Candidatus Margulisbacteria bacterium GWF2_38_17]